MVTSRIVKVQLSLACLYDFLCAKLGEQYRLEVAESPIWRARVLTS